MTPRPRCFFFTAAMMPALAALLAVSSSSSAVVSAFSSSSTPLFLSSSSSSLSLSRGAIRVAPVVASSPLLRPLRSSASSLALNAPSLLTLNAAATSAASASASTASSDKKKKTIQILMSDTGGGHRASANALRDALDVLYPGTFECDIVDIYTDYGPFWPYDSYVPLYKIMAEYSFLWDWFYHFGASPLGMALNEFLLEAFCFAPFKECLNRPSGSSGERADMVVSVHPLCQDVPLKIMTSLDTGGKSRTKGRTTPFVTVVTDLGGAHPTWFNKGVDKCFVPSDVLYDVALKRGLRPSQLTEHGLPIRSGFWSDGGANGKAAAAAGGAAGGASATKKEGGGMFGFLNFGGKGNNKSTSAQKSAGGDKNNANDNKNALRDSLDLKRDLPTVLIVGGGDGMGGIVGQAEALGAKLDADASSPPPPPRTDSDNDDEAGTLATAASASASFQMVVVCGNNALAQSQLASKQWGPGVSVQVNGFVENMDDYMRASDAIVTKAGPGTIAEASICGLPTMLSSYLPGQEAGNVPYVEEAGFGAYSGEPRIIAETVSMWLETPEVLEEMRGKALEAARPTATLDIARDIAAMLL